MQSILDTILVESRGFIDNGAVASYIPELANVDKNAFGICAITKVGEKFNSGNADAHFTMQSVVKPLILLQALPESRR